MPIWETTLLCKDVNHRGAREIFHFPLENFKTRNYCNKCNPFSDIVPMIPQCRKLKVASRIGVICSTRMIAANLKEWCKTVTPSKRK
jgi:hypothetical protein